MNTSSRTREKTKEKENVLVDWSLRRENACFRERICAETRAPRNEMISLRNWGFAVTNLFRIIRYFISHGVYFKVFRHTETLSLWKNLNYRVLHANATWKSCPLTHLRIFRREAAEEDTPHYRTINRNYILIRTRQVRSSQDKYRASIHITCMRDKRHDLRSVLIDWMKKTSFW